MAQLYIQRAVQPDAWVMSGAPATTVVWLSRDTDINYADGGTDTLPANTPAVLPDGSTNFNRTHDVYVGYCYKGERVLRVTKESLLPGLTQDYAPICRVLLHNIVSYQPEAYLAQATVQAVATGAWSGGAVLNVGRSWTGDAVAGTFDTESWTGAASVT